VVSRGEGVSKLLIWYPRLRTNATSFVGGDHDYPSAALPILSRDRYRETWSVAEGKQRYRCRACLEGRGRTFLLEYSYAAHSPEVKQQIVDMALNASGIRDTARVLHVSPTTVINELKKRRLTCKR
jgi:transposase-like protein